MSHIMGRGPRDSTVIPTMKCAQCNQDVHIRMIGQHQCPQQPVVPSLPAAYASRGLSTIFDGPGINPRDHLEHLDEVPAQRTPAMSAQARKDVESKAFPAAYKPALNFLAEAPDAPDDFDFASILPGSTSVAHNNSGFFDHDPHSQMNGSTASIDAYMAGLRGSSDPVVTAGNYSADAQREGGSMGVYDSSEGMMGRQSPMPMPMLQQKQQKQQQQQQQQQQQHHHHHHHHYQSVDEPSPAPAQQGMFGGDGISPGLKAAKSLNMPKTSKPDISGSVAEKVASLQRSQSEVQSPRSRPANLGVEMSRSNSTRLEEAREQLLSSLPPSNSRPGFKSPNETPVLLTKSPVNKTPADSIPWQNKAGGASLPSTVHNKSGGSKGTGILSTVTKASRSQTDNSTANKRIDVGIVPKTKPPTLPVTASPPSSMKKGGANYKLPTPTADSQIRISRKGSVQTDGGPSTPSAPAPSSTYSPGPPNAMPQDSSMQSSFDILSSLLNEVPTSPTHHHAPSPRVHQPQPLKPAPIPLPRNKQPGGTASRGIPLSAVGKKSNSPLAALDTHGAMASGRLTGGPKSASGGNSAGSLSAKSGGRTNKLDLLLDDLMDEMQALNVEMRTESDRDSMASSTASFRNSPASPTHDSVLAQNTRKTRLNSTVSTSSSSSTLSTGAACFACRGRIGNSSPVCVGNHVFHRMCFRCTECDRLLDPNSPSLFQVPGDGDSVSYLCERHQPRHTHSHSHSRQNHQQQNQLDLSKYQPVVPKPAPNNSSNHSSSSSNTQHSHPHHHHQHQAQPQAAHQPGTANNSPVCKSCLQPCGSTKDSVHALDAWWHRRCFTCQECRKPFPDKSFYVFEQMPYCRFDYHRLNGSLCAACHDPIEGPCAQVYEGRFHPHCFACDVCKDPLRDVYYNLNGRFLCEHHIQQQQSFKMANKRKTVFGRV